MVNQITKKLNYFVRLRCANNMLAGFFSFVFYLAVFVICAILAEQLFWCSTTVKTILVFSFLILLFFTFSFLVGRHMVKVIYPKSGISHENAARIIGDYFPEIDDKLINLVQLSQRLDKSELVKASVVQRSSAFSSWPFERAISWRLSFKKGSRLIFPLTFLLILISSGNWSSFSSSFNRLVDFRSSYVPPAPYTFVLENETLKAVAMSDYTVVVNIEGSQSPERVFMESFGSVIDMRLNRNGQFEHTFENVEKAIDFRISSAKVKSDPFRLDVIQPPKLNRLEILFNFPDYLLRPDETLSSFQDVMLPEGTKIELTLETTATDTLTIAVNAKPIKTQSNGSVFKGVFTSMKSEMVDLFFSNEQLLNYEAYQFNIKTVRDAYPELSIDMVSDSLNWNELQFDGIASDDYAITDVLMQYRPVGESEEPLEISLNPFPAAVVPFAASFPNNLDLDKEGSYEVRFVATDNDGVNGRKSIFTQWFRYNLLSESEKQEEMIRRQNAALKGLQTVVEQSERDNQTLEDLQRSQLEQSSLSFSDKQKLKEAIERQRQQDALMKSFNETTKKAIDAQQERKNDPFTESLKNRIEEQEKSLDRNEKLREEIEKYADKLNELDLAERLDELAKQKQSAQKSMAQVLELTKRFYVTQKAAQIGSSLDELADRQETLSKAGASSADNTETQEELNESFKKLEEAIDDLHKENDALKKPFDMPRDKATEEGIEQDQQKALDEIKQGQPAKISQSKASKGMKTLANQMSQLPFGGGGQQISEDIAMLRQILDNLLRFSFIQEDLMMMFESPNELTSDFANLLQRQQDLKNNFKHIDDSLFVLSLRQPMIAERVNSEISNVYFYTKKALENFADSQVNEGVAAQQYVMNSTNVLADQLSDMMDNLSMQMSPSLGQGEGEMQLPDIMMSQEQLAERMGKGKKTDARDGEEGGNDKLGERGSSKDDGSGQSDDASSTYEIFKEQQRLREAFQKLNEASGNGSQGQNILNEMERLERDLLDLGQSDRLKAVMKKLAYEMMKWNEAEKIQGQDDIRESQSGSELYNTDNKAFKLSKGTRLTIERLNRERLPMKPKMTTKANQYFLKDND